MQLLILLTSLLILAAVWQFTPLSEWLEPRRVTGWIAGIDSVAGRLALAVVGFTIGGLVMIPATLLVVIAALAFGAWEGFLYSMAGITASAVVGYAIGHVLGSDVVRRMGGSRIHRISQALGRRGMMAVFILQIVPFAPFTLGNLVAGASHIRVRDFIIGSLAGLAPGVAGLTIFSTRLMRAIMQPEPENLIVLAVVILVLGFGFWIMYHWLMPKGKRQENRRR